MVKCKKCEQYEKHLQRMEEILEEAQKIRLEAAEVRGALKALFNLK